MFKKLKNWLTRKKRAFECYKHWEKLSGVNELQKNNQVEHTGLSRYISLTDEEQKKIYTKYDKKEKEEKIKHVEDSLCGSCKKKITIQIKKDSKIYNDPPIVKIVCNSTTIYRFHFDCWKSINSVLDNRFKIKDDIEISGE